MLTVFRFEMHFRQRAQRVGRFQGRDDTFQTRQFECGIQRFVVVDSQHGRPLLRGEVRVNRTDARIIQSGRDRVGLFDLSVLVLHDQCSGPMNNTLFA